MNWSLRRCVPIGCLLLAAFPGRSAAAGPVSGLRAEARDGQVFVQWDEAETPPGTTFNVYVAGRPIPSPDDALRVGHHIERRSARDWWEDPASFTRGAPAGAPVGFLIVAGGRRLDPAGGLFVHTPPGAGPRDLAFAVTTSDALGREDRALVPGANAMTRPVRVIVPGSIRPIWQGAAPEPPPGRGEGRALRLSLHAKGGVVPAMEYLMFGDATMGWREGLPFKFGVRVSGDELVVAPTDRVWINRPHAEARDGGAPAIWTFWYGYNSKIYDRSLMREGVPTNYTERRNLWILDWVRSRDRPDMRRVYCAGGSMGGCGTLSFGLRHPEWFVGLHASVPIVAYTYLGKGSAVRLEPSCWVGAIPEGLRTDEGVGLLERMDGIRFVARSGEDLPMLFLIHGRRDGSIPWQNNPAFYRALNDARQPFAVYWDDGDHSTAGRDAPADVKGWLKRYRTLRRDEGVPAFSDTSSNRDPGDGRPEHGDIVGWMNRGMDWREIDDRPDRYAITVTADYPGVAYPVRTDVTLRRLQRFRPGPGARLRARVGERPAPAVERDAQGRIRIRRVEIPSREGVRITVEPGKSGEW